MTPQEVADFIAQQWVLHGDEIRDWITYHTWTMLLVAAVLTLLVVRDQNRRGKL